MVEIVADFFGIIGLSPVPPDNLAELIPYLLVVFVGVVLVSGVFRVVGAMAEVFLSFWRWR